MRLSREYGIVFKFSFEYEVNLGKLIHFYSPEISENRRFSDNFKRNKC